MRPAPISKASLIPIANVYHCGDGDIYEIAAAYAYHLAASPAYFDGNKRTGVQASLVFLEGCGLVASRLPEQQTYELMMKIAAHEADRSDLAEHFRSVLA